MGDLEEDFRRRLLAAVELVGRKAVTRADGVRRAADVSISQGGLTKILNGERPNPGIFTVKAIADAAGITVGQLLGEQPSMGLDLPLPQRRIAVKLENLNRRERVTFEELLRLFADAVAVASADPLPPDETKRSSEPYTPRSGKNDELRDLIDTGDHDEDRLRPAQGRHRGAPR